jgi:uncharacterized protein involved in exopolysaccharide biosynthesis
MNITSMNANNNSLDTLLVLRRIRNKWKTYAIVSVIVFAVSCLIILPVPRYYTCNVQLAPEMMNLNDQNSISALASSFGFNLGGAGTTDAIYPELYPNLMNSNDFIIHLINTKVKTIDNKIDTTYYYYLKKHQKKSPWKASLGWFITLFAKKEIVEKEQIDIFHLSKSQSDILDNIKKKVTCSVDKKTMIVNISVKDQDPLVCATIADAARKELQAFITNYRTSKARHDLEYYDQLSKKAKDSYEKARRLYGSYADANTDVILKSFKSKQEDLENDMQLKFNAYTVVNTQLENARAKVQETTPAFTVIKSPSVPLLPAGPKRMAFVLIMLIFSWIITTLYLCKDIIITYFINGD